MSGWVCFLPGLFLFGCQDVPKTQDLAQVEEVRIATAYCEDVGRDAGSYRAYVCCMHRAGLRLAEGCTDGGR